MVCLATGCTIYKILPHAVLCAGINDLEWREIELWVIEAKSDWNDMCYTNVLWCRSRLEITESTK